MPDVEVDTTAALPSPYKGLVPYSEDDAAYFFGRDRERQIITDNLQASRLTLIYGESGVGKTSVLRAGVVHTLRRDAREAQRRRLEAERVGTPDDEIDKPRFVVVEFATWRNDPLVGLPAAIETSVRLIYGDRTPDPPPPTRRLDDLLQGWAERLGADLLIIFDQFEEYLLYHARSDGEGTFAAELIRAVNAPDLRANFLVAIREDSLASLDRFKGKIAFLRNYYRVRHLDRAAARDAILKPVAQYDTTVPEAEAVTIEDALVERVLHDVAQGQVVVGQVGQGVVVASDKPEDRIEAPYLQLVMDRLWREERSRGSAVLRLATLDELGGAERIVRTHLDNAMADLSPERQDLAAQVFRFLVTPGGTKIQLAAADLAEFASVPKDGLTEVLEELATSRTRILRSVLPAAGETESRYEIYHDVLAPAILDWRSRYQEKRRTIEAEARIRQESDARVAATRRRAIRVALVVVLAVAAIGGGLAIRAQADQADRQVAEAKAEADARTEAARTATTRAESEAHVEQATAELAADPQLSLLHALMGWDMLSAQQMPPNAGVKDAIRLALSQAHLASRIDVHKDVVWSAAFSPTGDRIVTASNDDTAAIEDATTGETLHLLQGHTDIVANALFSPDGSRVVTASNDGTAKVWDATTGTLLRTLDHDGAAPRFAATDTIDRDGGYVATGAFTKDGRSLITWAGTDAWIWDLDSEAKPQKLPHPTTVESASFSADGTFALTAGDDGRAWIWDVATGKVVGEPMDNAAPSVTTATFSPDGKLIACGLGDGGVAIWNTSTRKVTFRSDHKDRVDTVEFSADSGSLLTAGEKIAYVIDVTPLTDDDDTTGTRLLSTIDLRASWIDAARFSPDGHYVVTANQDGTARVADASTGAELFALRGHTGIVWTARFSPDGSRVVTASEDGTVRVWNVGIGTELRGHNLPVNSVRFTEDGAKIVTAAWDETASIWDATTGEEVSRVIGSDRPFGRWPIGSAEPVDDGQQVLTAQADGTVAFWDLATGKQTRTCCVHSPPPAEGPVVAAGEPGEAGTANADATMWGASWAEEVPHHPDRVVVQYDDSSVHVWDVTTGAGSDIQSFTEGAVVGFALSPDGSTIVTVGRDDKRARVWHADWDANTFAEVGGWSSGLVSSLEFSPDGRSIVMGGLDGVVRVWDVANGTQIVHERPDELRLATGAAVTAVAFDTKGSWILAGGSNGDVRIWDATSGEFLADMHVHAGAVNSIDTTADGRIATGSDDHSAKVFVCSICGPIDDVVGLARDQMTVDPMDATQP